MNLVTRWHYPFFTVLVVQVCSQPGGHSGVRGAERGARRWARPRPPMVQSHQVLRGGHEAVPEGRQECRGLRERGGGGGRKSGRQGGGRRCGSLRLRWVTLKKYYCLSSSLLRNQIREPVPFRPLDPGWKIIRIRIGDEQPESYFRELESHFLN